MNQLTLFLIFCCFSLTPLSANENMTEVELEKWFNEDEATPPTQVSEGELVFLPKPPKKPPVHSITEVTINNNSINDGWVKLYQCYKNLDAVGLAKVIELEDVSENAELCVTAEIRVFYQNNDKSFSLINGPYHRKFLDGYFPYHVTLIVNYPDKKLNHISNKPVTKPGVSITKEKNKLVIDALFSGMLNTEIVFKEITK